MPRRVLILRNIISPHALGYFEHLSRDKGIDLTVWFCAVRTSMRLWNTSIRKDFKWEVLKGVTIEIDMEERIDLQFNPSILWKINQNKFDVVILGGWVSPTFWLASIICRIHRIPTIVWSGSVPGKTAFPGKSRRLTALRRSLTRFIAKGVVNNASAYIAYGTRSKRYLEELGACSDRIFIAWNTIDIEYISRKSDLLRSSRDTLRKKYGFREDDIIFLYVGRLLPVKQIDILLEAFVSVLNRVPKAVLAVAGFGPLERCFNNYKNRYGFNKFRTLGYIPLDKMAEVYTISDVFVMPSSDIWALAVNEAMACKLPVVVADSVGSSEDLVKDHFNGFVFQTGDQDALASILIEMANDEVMRLKMGENSRLRIGSFSYENATQGLIRAIECAVQRTE